MLAVTSFLGLRGEFWGGGCFLFFSHLIFANFYLISNWTSCPRKSDVHSTNDSVLYLLNVSQRLRSFQQAQRSLSLAPPSPGLHTGLSLFHTSAKIECCKSLQSVRLFPESFLMGIFHLPSSGSANTSEELGGFWYNPRGPQHWRCLSGWGWGEHQPLSSPALGKASGSAGDWIPAALWLGW